MPRLSRNQRRRGHQLNDMYKHGAVVEDEGRSEAYSWTKVGPRYCIPLYPSVPMSTPRAHIRIYPLYYAFEVSLPLDPLLEYRSPIDPLRACAIAV